MPLVSLMTFRTAEDAELAAAVVRDQGVTGAIARGVTLQVPLEAVERAETVLGELSPVDTAAAQSNTSAERAIRHPELCPHCGSPDVRRTHRLLGFAMLAALLFALGVAVNQLIFSFYLTLAACIFFLIASPYRCGNCGHRW